MNQQNNNTAGRSFAVKFLYQIFLKENHELKKSFENNTVDQEQLNQLIDDFTQSYIESDNEHLDNTLSPSQRSHGKKILDQVQGEYNKVGELIANSIKTSINGLDPFDRAALFVGVTEICFLKIPFQIVANELVTICKKYSNESSAKFINGVLDAIGRSQANS